MKVVFSFSVMNETIHSITVGITCLKDLMNQGIIKNAMYSSGYLAPDFDGYNIIPNRSYSTMTEEEIDIVAKEVCSDYLSIVRVLNTNRDYKKKFGSYCTVTITKEHI